MSDKIEGESLYEILVSIVGFEYVSDEDFELWCVSRDGSEERPQMPSFVVMPRTTHQVSKIVRVANEFKVPIWPRGGGTGLDGCGMPLRPGGIVVDLTQMNKVLEINKDQMTATVQAGIVLRTLEQKLKEHGLHPRIEGCFGAGLGCTVAGGITAGAMGLGKQYGTYCEQLVCLEVVLPNGDIIRTGSDANPASGRFARYVNGPDVAGIFCLSHGIFGIITEVTIRLIPQPEAFAFLTPIFSTQEAMVNVMKKIGIYELAYSYLTMLGSRSVQWGYSSESTAEGIMYVSIQGRKKEVEYKKEFLDEIIREEGGEDLGPGISKKLLFDDDPHLLVPSASKGGRWITACNFMPIQRVIEFGKMAEKFFHEEKRGIFEKYGFKGPYLFPDGLVGYATIPHMVYYDEHKPETWDALRMLWGEWRARIVAWGGAPYHIGATFGLALAPEWRGPYYSFIKTLKRTLDPNNTMNPGMFGNV
jgi:FAD/FMN-containing dehydrogenase